MKTTSIPNLVSYLLGMFDTLVLLVAWPSGKKGCKGVDFTKVTLQDMMAPEYQRKLAAMVPGLSSLTAKLPAVEDHGQGKGPHTFSGHLLIPIGDNGLINPELDSPKKDAWKKRLGLVWVYLLSLKRACGAKK